MRPARAVVPFVVVASFAFGAAPAVASVKVQALSVTEGQAFAGTVAAVISRCGTEALMPVVSWGDGATTAGQAVATGQSTFDVHATHTYAEEGTYGLSVTVKNCSTGGVESDQVSVQVADAALASSGVSLSATAGTPFSGPVAAFVDGDPGGTPSDYVATIDWGDGHTTPGTVVDVPGAGFEVRGSESYASAGSYAVTVAIHDTGGATTVASSSMTVAAAPATRQPPPPPQHGFVAAGADRRHVPQVRLYDAITGQLRSSFLAYSSGFRGGVRVAVGDVNGDGVGDVITGPGPGAAPHVKVFSGANGHRLRSFLAFDASFRKGVYVAAGDVNGDRRADVIVGADAGAGPKVKVFNGATGHLRSSFLAYGASFTGGVRVAAGDVNGDGRADVIAGTGPGVGPHVKVLSGANGATLMSFLPYGPSPAGGVRVGAADADGDGRADVLAGAGPGGGPRVKLFSGADASTLSSFFAGSPSDGAVFVAGGR